MGEYLNHKTNTFSQKRLTTKKLSNQFHSEIHEVETTEMIV